MSTAPSTPQYGPMERLPLYHADRLVIRMRPAARPMVSAAAAMVREGSGRADTFESAGASALASFQRAGLIRRVTPIAAEAGGRGPFLGPQAAMVALSASMDAPEGTMHARASVLDLQPGTDIGQIQVALASDPLVEFVGRLPVRYLFAKASKPKPKRAGRKPRVAATTPPPSLRMWNLQRIRWEQARARPKYKDGSTIKVAVLDSGVDASHPDLRGRIAEYSYDYPDLPNNPTEQDVIGHGTHVTGTITAVDNSFGIQGICSSPIYVHKIFPDSKNATFYDPNSNTYAYGVDPIMYLRSLRACLDQGVKVVNLSIGGYGEPDQEEADAFQALIDAGITVVAAMGNDNTSQLSYPAAISGVIAVGATSLDDTRSTFSNYGPHIALCAPGEGIWSTLPTYTGNMGYRNAGDARSPTPGAPIPRPGGTDYAAWDGTSMATPHVSAATALLLANKPKISAVAVVRGALTSSAVKVKDMGGVAFTRYYGNGRLDLYDLLK